jgi:hypothetical protein
LFLTSFVVFIDATQVILEGYDISLDDITNGTDMINITNSLDIYNGEQQELLNTTQYAPGNPEAQQQDPGSSTTAIAQSSWTTGIKFIQKVFSLPMVIINIIGGVLPVDPRWTSTWILSLVIIIVFILISATFFNKL